MRGTLLVGLLVVGGCASLAHGGQPRPEVVFERGLQALEQQDFRSAYEQFSWVYEVYWDRPIGERALLALAAVELDPRNPDRRLYVGADLAGRHYQLPTARRWNEPVSQTLYLLALELGATEERLARAEAEREQAEQARARAERERQAARAQAQQAATRAQRAQAEATRARAEARRAQAQRTQPAAAPARALPQLSSPTVTARVNALQTERDRLAREVQTLRSRVAQQDEELERIRRTLSPRP
jgi:chemotaxis protein histidine kinase CheA